MVSKRLRLLQGIAAILIISAIGMFIIDGQPLSSSVIVGSTYGVLVFIPIAVLLMMYWWLQPSFEG